MDEQNVIKTIEKGNRRIKIGRDEYLFNPREENENAGTMACFHKRYKLGDKHTFKTPEELNEFLDEEKTVHLPLYLYDHSGITMNTKGFHCPWDSGQVGFIYITYEKILEVYGGTEVTDETIRKAENLLRGEVEEYDRYLRGEQYCYEIYEVKHCKECGHTEEVFLQTCGGYESEESCIKDAESELLVEK